MGVSVLKFNQVFDILLKQKPLESKFIDLLVNLKKDGDSKSFGVI